VRRRLAVAIVATAALAVVLFAVPLAVVLGRVYRDEELLRLQRDTVAATRELDLATPGDPVELPPSRDRLSVYARDGRRVAGRGGAVADAVVRAAIRTGRPTDATEDGRLVVAVPLLTGERVTGAVRAERPAAAAADDAHDAWLVLAGLGLAAIAAAGVAALLLARRLAVPLERLAVAARRLGDGDFSARSPRAGVPEVDAVGDALDGTARRLDDLVARERAFSADASHQLRTPLAALRLELEALELRAGETPELAAALGQVDRLQATIDTLLAVARDTPRTSADATVRDVLTRLEARWRGPLAAAGRPLRIRAESARARVRASGAVLDEVLDVLLANAECHGAGEVTVRVRDAGSSVAIDVSDEGPGFAGDPQGAFVRRAPSDDGHGIGLALARSLAQSEGGRLLVSRPAPDPVVTVLLPADM
jgi:signal transduction histidine kinase